MNDTLIGTRLGKLVVIEYIGFYAKPNTKKKNHFYKCKCDCGNYTVVGRDHLNIKAKKFTTSCGCVKLKHGYHSHNAYNIYKCMMRRVHNPDLYRHKHYIENNIKICKEWDGHPDVFCRWADANGFKKGLTLDRIDSLGDYCPENCRWTTPLVQANNRPSYNKNISFNGKTQSIAMWARELGIRESTLRSRLAKKRMSIEEAFTKPIDKRFSSIENFNRS